jgi:hypothetical protein
MLLFPRLLPQSGFQVAFSIISFFLYYAAASTECELCIADSTIPNAGLGVFTGIERNPGDTVGEGEPS